MQVKQTTSVAIDMEKTRIMLAGTWHGEDLVHAGMVQKLKDGWEGFGEAIKLTGGNFNLVDLAKYLYKSEKVACDKILVMDMGRGLSIEIEKEQMVSLQGKNEPFDFSKISATGETSRVPVDQLFDEEEEKALRKAAEEDAQADPSTGE